MNVQVCVGVNKVPQVEFVVVNSPAANVESANEFALDPPVLVNVKTFSAERPVIK